MYERFYLNFSNALSVFKSFTLTGLSSLILSLIGLVALTLGCNHSPTPPSDGEDVELNIVTLDEVMVLDAADYHLISVQIDPIERGLNRTMIATVSGLGITENFHLYDDGGRAYRGDASEFTDTLSGDYTAGDGIYSRRIRSTFGNMAGEYSLLILLLSEPTDSLTASITIRENEAPQIVSSTFPEQISSGTNGEAFRIKVIDLDGNDDIVEAELLNLDRDTLFYEMIMIDDSTWHWLSKPEISARLETGWHKFQYRIQDRLLKQSKKWVYSEIDSVELENEPPEIVAIFRDDLEIGIEDTIYVPDKGDNPDSIVVRAFEYHAILEDEQTALDIDYIQLNLYIVADPTDPSDRDTTITYKIHDDGRSIEGLGDGVLFDTLYFDNTFVMGFGVHEGTDRPYNREIFLEWIPIDHVGQVGDPYLFSLKFLRAEEASSALLETQPRNYVLLDW